MIVIHEDILNKVILVHVLLVLVNIFWLFFFSVYIGIQYNPGWKRGLVLASPGWWRGGGRASEPVAGYQESGPRQRRGWFGGDRG